MGSSPFRVWLGFSAAVLAGLTACRTEGKGEAGPPAPECEEQRIAAKLIVLAVDSMDQAAARRIETMLADEYDSGVVSALADPSTKLVTVLARADSDITIAASLDLLEALGLEAREADEAEYEAARASLASRTLAIPVSGGSAIDGAAQTCVQSLEASLTSLRSRFNADQGKLRFIALLSPT